MASHGLPVDGAPFRTADSPGAPNSTSRTFGCGTDTCEMHWQRPGDDKWYGFRVLQRFGGSSKAWYGIYGNKIWMKKQIYIYIYRLGNICIYINIYWYYMSISWYGSYLGFYHPKTNMVQTYHYPFLLLDEDAFTVPAVWVSHPWIIHIMEMLNAKMSFVTTGWNGLYTRNIQYHVCTFSDNSK